MNLHEKIQARAYDNKLPYPSCHEGVAQDTGYLKLRHEYGLETARLEAQFRADLFREYGVTNNPLADRAFYLAWEQVGIAMSCLAAIVLIVLVILWFRSGPPGSPGWDRQLV